ncbi:MAG: membrane protein insertion efficiency factor YidD [Gloeocapsa sp. UFS-A4-WI-NPMV-4B04]|jgi:putative component of membrane protein insertase Oxa1/YidC/SpoIIIJ protein YidD|nr:membrane protein insertion efficiency factor YidD [Gloeocapsa sp. UFS-A4-WI-NPMV-4B04]
MLKNIVKSYRLGGLKKTLKIRKGSCLYTETCSAYAERMINEKGEVKASPLILQRILLCNPIGYRKIGINLYEKKDLSKQVSSQAKANFILAIFLTLIFPMQVTGFLVFKEFAFKPISSMINNKES